LDKKISTEIKLKELLAAHRPQKEKFSLFTDLNLKQETLAQIYVHIGQYSSIENLLKCAPSHGQEKKIYSIKYVPSYFRTTLLKPEDWTEKSYSSVKGYSFLLESYRNVDEYLHSNLSVKRRKNVLRAINRLERCFEIKYEIIQANITTKEYSFLMDNLKAMIVRRFKQRGHESHTLRSWDKIVSSSYDLLLQKKASLFVIYNGNVPIVISFNHHYNSNLFNYISSYDIDYAKFSLGQIKFYKQLEWCFNNGYSQLDLGWGDMNYKKWWSNNVYSFNHHILYPKNSITGFLYANWEGNKSRIMAFLIANGVNTRLKKIKAMLKSRSSGTEQTKTYSFGEIDFLTSDELEHFRPQKLTFPITKKIFYDFLFLTHEHQSDVVLYYSPASNEYLLQGKKVAKRVLLNS